AVKGFCRRLMPDLYQQHFKYNETLDAQAGHSGQTANRHYGRSTDEIADMTEHYFRICRNTSLMWHALLSGESKSTVAVAVPKSAVTLELEQQVSKQWEAIERIDTVIQAAVTRPPILTLPELLSRDDMLKELRKYLGKPDADFNNGQYDVLRLVLGRSEDLLVVLPTGGGKSLTVLLPALIENPGTLGEAGIGPAHGVCTVIIVPLVALQTEWFQRAEYANYGMRPTWPPKYHGDGGGIFSVYIVSIEEACTPLFRNQLDSLYHAGKLARIVLDEAHLVTAHRSFRHHLRHIAELRAVP
ncbi:hypothetical protein RI367_008848, partial [Sorochytrium milnesiophthora]